jgi:prolyl oligopeptidase
VLNVLEDVKNKIRIMKPGKAAGGRACRRHAGGRHGRRRRHRREDGNALWLTTTDFLTPTTLSMVEIGEAAAEAQVDAGVLRSRHKA